VDAVEALDADVAEAVVEAAVAEAPVVKKNGSRSRSWAVL
jgi:hypothetical protein